MERHGKGILQIQVLLWMPEELTFLITLKLRLGFSNLHLSAFFHVMQPPCHLKQNYFIVAIQTLFKSIFAVGMSLT